MTIPIIDGHLDIAMNALAYDRDQTWTIEALRRREAALPPPESAERGTPGVSLPALRAGDVRLVVGTLFARARAHADPAKCLRRIDSDSGTPSIAHAAAHAQLAYYRLLEAQGHMRLITTRAALDRFWARDWSRDGSGEVGLFRASNGHKNDTAAIPPPQATPNEENAEPVGCIVLMECADPITWPGQVEHWWGAGVRAVSLAHQGPAVHAVGNGADGPVTDAGRELLKKMADLGMALDLSHLSDTSFHEAMDIFRGAVLASHTNCRSLAPGDRQFSDVQLRQIIQRGGVIGVVLYNKMLNAAWKGDADGRKAMSLSHVVDHIDHICELAGDARHVAIGSDLDGGFGIESTPREIDTIADLQKLAPLLAGCGYNDADIAAIFHGNWLRFWRGALPTGV